MTEVLRRIVIGVLCVAVVGLGAYNYTHSPQKEPEAPRLEDVDEDADVEWDYVIPAGTAERLAAGEEVEIVPKLIEAAVGESIRIENRDTEAQELGPWHVSPGETVTQRFASEGVIEGPSNLHPSGEIRVDVAADHSSHTQPLRVRGGRGEER